MKSMWRVMTKTIAGTEFYQVYRLKDVSADNTEKNRETYGGLWSTLAEAVRLAERKNEEGK